MLNNQRVYIFFEGLLLTVSRSLSLGLLDILNISHYILIKLLLSIYCYDSWFYQISINMQVSILYIYIQIAVGKSPSYHQCPDTAWCEYTYVFNQYSYLPINQSIILPRPSINVTITLVFYHCRGLIPCTMIKSLVGECRCFYLKNKGLNYPSKNHLAMG